MDAGAETGVDRRALWRHTVARALNDRVHLRMADEFVLRGTLEALRSILDSPRQSIEACGNDLLRWTHDHRAHSARRIFAPPRNRVSEFEEAKVPLE